MFPDAAIVCFEGFPCSIVYVTGANPARLKIALRRAVRNNRLACAGNFGLIAYRLCRYSPLSGWFAPLASPDVPYTFSYLIRLEGKIPVIDIRQFRDPLSKHDSTNLKAKTTQKLFAWVGSEYGQSMLSEKIRTDRGQAMINARARNKAAHARLMRLQEQRDVQRTEGEVREYLPHEERIRDAILSDRRKRKLVKIDFAVQEPQAPELDEPEA